MKARAYAVAEARGSPHGCAVGCVLAGVVLVTVNPAFRAQELEYVLKQSRAADVFVVEAFRGNPMHATVKQVAPNCPELRDVIRFDAWQDFLARGDAPGITLPPVKPTDPVMIQYTVAMMEHPAFAAAALSSTQSICSGGSLVPEALVRRFEEQLGAPFTIVFGQTECSPVASMTRPDDSVADKAGTIGRPMPHVEVKIIDPASGDTRPVGQVGEYCTRGYHVMHGYFENPEATAAAIDADGWLHTGDLCAMDARGYCTVQGRLKDMVIRGGENIYPRELEELLFKHPMVGEVAVVGLPDAKWGEVVAAFVRPKPGQRIDKEVLVAYMREQLAHHKTPKHWFEVEAFPLTGSGKIQKFKLRERWLAGEFGDA